MTLNEIAEKLVRVEHAATVPAVWCVKVGDHAIVGDEIRWRSEAEADRLRAALLPVLEAAHAQGLHDALHGDRLPGAELTAEQITELHRQVEAGGVAGYTAVSVSMSSFRGMLAHINFLAGMILRMRHDSDAHQAGLEIGRRRGEEAMRREISRRIGRLSTGDNEYQELYAASEVGEAVGGAKVTYEEPTP